MNGEANSGSDSDSTVEGKTPGEILEGPKIKPPSSDQIEALSPTSFYIYNKNTESYTLKNEDATKRRRSSSRSSKRRPTTKRPHVASTSEKNKIISPAKHRVRDSSSLLTPVQIDEMFPAPQISTDKEEDEASVSSKSSSNSSVFSSSLCVTATSFKNFYVQATIHDTGGVRLVLMSSSKVAYTLNATLTDADRLLLNLERNTRRKNRRQVLAPWLPKLCTSNNLLCACTSSGSIYFISSDYRSYRFEYGTSVCDFAMSRSTFFGGKESFVLVIVPRNSRHIEVYRLVDSIVGEDDS